jgi:hypothetical protein
MLLPQIPHAIEMGGTGEGGDADPCIARSCFRGNGAGGTSWELTIKPGRGLINIAHKYTIIGALRSTNEL